MGEHYYRELDLDAGPHTFIVAYYEHRGSAKVGAGRSILGTPTSTATLSPTSNATLASARALPRQTLTPSLPFGAPPRTG